MLCDLKGYKLQLLPAYYGGKFLFLFLYCLLAHAFSLSIFTVSLQAFAPNPAIGRIVPRHLILYARSHNEMNFHLIGLKTLKRRFFHIFLQ